MEFKNNRPIYQQIADYIGEQILSGHYCAGHQMPGLRELAGALQVSLHTVQCSYRFLRTQGVLEKKRGKGHWVCDQALAHLQDIWRRRFFEKELSLFFKELCVLDIEFSLIEKEFERYKQNLAAPH